MKCTLAVDGVWSYHKCDTALTSVPSTFSGLISLEGTTGSFPQEGLCIAYNPKTWPGYSDPFEYTLRLQLRREGLSTCGNGVTHVGMFFNMADEENFDQIFLR